MSADNFKVRRVAICPGRCLEPDVALNARLPGKRRINRIDMADRRRSFGRKSLASLQRGTRRKRPSELGLGDGWRATTIETERYRRGEIARLLPREEPLLHGIGGGLRQQGMATHHLHRGHMAIGPERAPDLDVALNARLPGKRRINRIDLGDAQEPG